MPDFDGVDIDAVEAHGKAAAALCLLQSLMAVLNEKGIISHEEGLMVCSNAFLGISAMASLPDAAKVMGRVAIKGVTKAWSGGAETH
jgi:hypothetical protein